MVTTSTQPPPTHVDNIVSNVGPFDRSDSGTIDHACVININHSIKIVN